MDDEKKEKEGVLAKLSSAAAVIQKGIEGAKEKIKSALIPQEPPIFTDKYYDLITDELIHKIQVHYSGQELLISDIKVTPGSSIARNGIKARLIGLYDADGNAQEAELTAVLEIPDLNVIPVSIYDTGGIETYQSVFTPTSDYKPVARDIVLDMVKTSYAPKMVPAFFREIMSKNYPGEKMLGLNKPLILERDKPYCDRFIRTKNTSIVRYVRFETEKKPMEKKPDDNFTVRDYEYKFLPPQTLFEIEYPAPRQILGTLKKEKSSLRTLVNDYIKPSVLHFPHNLFFRIQGDFEDIEPNYTGGTDEAEVSFKIEFNCVTGISPFVKQYPVSAEFYYAAGSVLNKTGREIKTLKYLRHGEFAILPTVFLS